MEVAVIGAGAWGTTLAILIAENGNDVNLWVREKELVKIIKEKKENKWFLPGVDIPDNLAPTNDLSIVNDAEVIVTAVPSQFLRDVAKKMDIKGKIIVNVSKGFEHTTFKTMSEVLDEVLPGNMIVVLSGPNHAEEVSKKIPTATVIASKDQSCLSKVKDIFSTGYFKVYLHDDVLGLEICAALKNIIAIGCGITDGMKFGDNSKGSIITFGLREMSVLAKHFGAKEATLYGLAGVGDLVATCTSKHSRNRKVGELIAQGYDFEKIKEIMHGQVAEGVKTCESIHNYAKKKGIKLPLTSSIYEILFEKKDLKKAVADFIGLI